MISRLALQGIPLSISDEFVRRGILRGGLGKELYMLGFDPQGRVCYASRLDSAVGDIQELSGSDVRCPIFYDGAHKRSPLRIFLSPLNMISYLGLLSLEAKDFREDSCMVLPETAQSGNCELLERALYQVLSSHSQIQDFHLYLPRGGDDLVTSLRDVLPPKKTLHAHFHAPQYDFSAQLMHYAGRIRS